MLHFYNFIILEDENCLEVESKQDVRFIWNSLKNTSEK